MKWIIIFFKTKATTHTRFIQWGKKAAWSSHPRRDASDATAAHAAFVAPGTAGTPVVTSKCGLCEICGSDGGGGGGGGDDATRTGRAAASADAFNARYTCGSIALLWHICNTNGWLAETMRFQQQNNNKKQYCKTPHQQQANRGFRVVEELGARERGKVAPPHRRAHAAAW
jgi:hypothetical protein